MADTKSTQDVIKAVQDSPLERVKVAIVDMDGVLRGKYIHKNKFLSAIEGGFGFCDVVLGWDCADVCYDNVSFTGWHSGYPDAHVRLDPQSYRQVPWDHQVPFLLGDFRHADGQPLEICPRQLLKSVIAKYTERGLKPKVGFEFEWFNFEESPQSLADKKFINPKPITPGMFGYSLYRAGLNRDYITTIMEEMEAFGVPIEGLHTETGPGVLEAALVASDALEAADRAVLFKAGAKEIANRFGWVATFMAKWDATLPGCSGHMHQSLGDESGKNVFSDSSGSHGMSKLFEHYLAGQMLTLPEFLPMYAPTINSYKRLTEGMWAPTKVAWGVDNRTAAMRVIAQNPKSTRLETRVSGSDINPYLSLAAALASGLHGIEKELTLSSGPVSGSAYDAKDAIRLPTNLYQATQAMQKSTLAKDLLGEAFVDHFCHTRLWEWRQYEQAVTSWELERYFEII
jgi:glutamine synthetase